MKKKRKYGKTAIVIMLVFSISGIIAYFSATDEKINIIEIAHNQIIPIEEFEEPEIGKKTVKKPQAENVGNTDCYVRAKILLSDSRAESYIEYYHESLLGFNTCDWTEREDGWLYYNTVLRSGERSTPIFSHIKLTDAIPDDIQKLNIDVIFESVQSDSFSDPLEAFDTISWEENK